MNIFKIINDITSYIEEHLLDRIELKDLSKLTGLNISTIKSVFPLIAGCGISEYIRNRRLSVCIEDLRDGKKVIDVALKYGYNSTESFIRAFKKFHGTTPNSVRGRNTNLNLYPRLLLNDKIIISHNINYQLYYKRKFTLYGVKKTYKTKEISLYTEDLWSKVKNEYPIFLTSDKRYGLTEHIDNTFSNYYCLIDKEYSNLEKKEIKSSDYLGVKLSSFKSKDISNEIRNCFKSYLKLLNFKAKNTPIIEVYTNNYVELLIPIN